MRIKSRAKELVVGTPFENIARRTYKQVHRRFYDDPINASYDRQTISVMKRTLSRDSNCIDVGSSIGDMLLEMLHFAPAGTHYAFEPIPSSYRRLTDSFSTVHLHNLALSDTTGEKSFQHVITNAGYSGLMRREYPRQHEAIEEITVRTDLLDNIVPESLAISFIKIDVEGAELQVLRGGINTIRRNRPVVIFEHQLGAADFYGTTPEELYDLLVTQCNLRVSLMEDWLKGKNPLSQEVFADQFYNRTNYYFMAHA